MDLDDNNLEYQIDFDFGLIIIGYDNKEPQTVRYSGIHVDPAGNPINFSKWSITRTRISQCPRSSYSVLNGFIGENNACGVNPFETGYG